MLTIGDTFPQFKATAVTGLQPGHQFAHARRRQAQFTRGLGEAAEIDDADEDLHLGGTVGVETGHVEFTSQMIGLRTS